MSSYPDDYIFKSQHEWCFDASVGVLIHQQKIREIVDGSKNMFIYHGLGSGKTCTTDQRKFLKFLQKNMLLPIYKYQ